MKLVKIGEASINPDQVTSVTRVFYSDRYSEDHLKYTKLAEEYHVHTSRDDQWQIRKVVDEEFPNGAPKLENYWVTRVRTADGESFHTADDLNAVESLLQGD